MVDGSLTGEKGPTLSVNVPLLIPDDNLFPRFDLHSVPGYRLGRDDVTNPGALVYRKSPVTPTIPGSPVNLAPSRSHLGAERQARAK